MLPQSGQIPLPHVDAFDQDRAALDVVGPRQEPGKRVFPAPVLPHRYALAGLDPERHAAKGP